MIISDQCQPRVFPNGVIASFDSCTNSQQYVTQPDGPTRFSQSILLGAVSVHTSDHRAGPRNTEDRHEDLSPLKMFP